MNRDESHRQARGLSFPPGTSSCGILELKLQAVQERVMIDRSFVNCPRLRHTAKFSLLQFQSLTNGQVIALSGGSLVLTQFRYTRLAPSRVSRKNSEEQNASSIG